MFKSKLTKQVAKELAKHNIKIDSKGYRKCGNCMDDCYEFRELHFYQRPLGERYSEWSRTNFWFCDQCSAMTYKDTESAYRNETVSRLSDWWKKFVCSKLPIELAKQEREKLQSKIDELSKYISEMEKLETDHQQVHKEEAENKTLTTSAYR